MPKMKQLINSFNFALFDFILICKIKSIFKIYKDTKGKYIYGLPETGISSMFIESLQLND